MVDVLIPTGTPNNSRGQNLDCVQLTDNRFFFVFYDGSTPSAAVVDFTDFRNSDAYTITVQKSLGIGTFAASSNGITIAKFTSEWVLVTLSRNVYYVNVTATDFSVTAIGTNLIGFGNTLSLTWGPTNNSYNAANKHIDIITDGDSSAWIVSFSSSTTGSNSLQAVFVSRSNGNFSTTRTISFSSATSQGITGFRSKFLRFENPFTNNIGTYLVHGPGGSSASAVQPFDRLIEFSSTSGTVRTTTFGGKSGLVLEDRNQVIEHNNTLSNRNIRTAGLPGGPVVSTVGLIKDLSRPGSILDNTQIYDSLKLDNNYYLLCFYDLLSSSPRLHTGGYSMYKICSDRYHQSINNITEGFNYPNPSVGNQDLGILWPGRDSFRKFNDTLVVFHGYPGIQGSDYVFPIKRIAV